MSCSLENLNENKHLTFRVEHGRNGRNGLCLTVENVTNKTRSCKVVWFPAGQECSFKNLATFHDHCSLKKILLCNGYRSDRNAWTAIFTLARYWMLLLIEPASPLMLLQFHIQITQPYVRLCNFRHFKALLYNEDTKFHTYFFNKYQGWNLFRNMNF